MRTQEPEPELPPAPLVIPPGWRTASHEGRPYYIDPQGTSHWSPPPQPPATASSAAAGPAAEPVAALPSTLSAMDAVSRRRRRDLGPWHLGCLLFRPRTNKSQQHRFCGQVAATGALLPLADAAAAPKPAPAPAPAPQQEEPPQPLLKLLSRDGTDVAEVRPTNLEKQTSAKVAAAKVAAEKKKEAAAAKARAKKAKAELEAASEATVGGGPEETKGKGKAKAKGKEGKKAKKAKGKAKKAKKKG